jgi:hypothetical protein
MGLLDRIFGRGRQGNQQYAPPSRYETPRGRPENLPDDQAIARYRYLLRTAPPEQIEQAHAEAFAQLTVDQRQQVLAQLAAAVPAGERPRTDDPETLARAATRAEMRQPGTLERALGGYGPSGPGYGGGYRGGYGPGYGYGGGMGMGSMIGGSLLGTIGGLVIGSAVADALFDTGLGDGGLFGGGDEEAYAEGYQDGADNGWDGGGDYGGGDFGGGDFGGGDFGGGDF